MDQKIRKISVSSLFVILVATMGLGLSPDVQAKKVPRAQRTHKAESATPKAAGTPETLEQLDSAANLLMTIADADKPGVCGINPSEARRLLLAIHPIFDEKKNAAIAALSAHPATKPIANPKWEQNCLRKCHCGLYASILEGVGEQRLVPSDRETLGQLSSKARVMTREHLEVCARTSRWFCKSRLLARLKEDAKSYPDPMATNPVPAPVSPKKKGENIVSPSVRHY